jgi:2-amino-4-hydroxy-6-hydroxymethyldihydropteridine diphosphokinase
VPTPAGSSDNRRRRQSLPVAQARQAALAESRRCYLGLGSNLGRRACNLAAAVSLLTRSPGLALRRLSSVYLTPPVGPADQPDFLNLVACYDSDLAPDQLLEAALRVEQRLGRVRTVRWGPRIIDVDILLMGDLQIAWPDLTVPHPRLRERQFVLVPLAEIAPRLELPGGGVVGELAGGETDQVRRLGRLAELAARELEPAGGG